MLVTIPMMKREKEQLERLAFAYGLSLPQVSQKILKAVMSSISLESIEEYGDSKKLRQSLRRAWKEYRAGHISRDL